jgi:transcriptional regulator with XRE-family HTH domain
MSFRLRPKFQECFSYNPDFGKRLKELRTELNYTQKDISDKTDLTLRTMRSATVYFKINDMNQFMDDLKKLFKNNWKIIALIFVLVYLGYNYTEIKTGLLDGWNGN